jgi:hypothetical protein
MMALLYKLQMMLQKCFSAHIVNMSMCFLLLDVTLIIKYMLCGMCHMLDERQVAVQL